MRAYYFGCWNQAGHHLHGPSGTWVPRVERRAVDHYDGGRIHIDSALAPRMRASGEIGWAGKWGKPLGAEMSQGSCLVHHLDSGFTAMQWWDRTQGDTRPGCNSTILLEGKHDFETMVKALRKHFPAVAANLDKAGIKLVEIQVK